MAVPLPKPRTLPLADKIARFADGEIAPMAQSCRYPQAEIPGPLTVIPKLRNDNSYYPTLCGHDRFVNVSQIKDLDGHNKPAETPQVGCG